jgi:putative oxidoreductase
MKDLGLLGLRLVTGLLMAGHGAQKLFGWFEGHGLEATADWVASLGLKPGKPWAALGGLSEFAGGILTAAGFLNPLGPIGVLSAMAMATGKVHWRKPIWVTSGGAELPVTTGSAALAVALAGPGRLSVDRLFHIRVPGFVTFAAALGAAAAVAAGIASRPESEAASNLSAEDEEILSDMRKSTVI